MTSVETSIPQLSTMEPSGSGSDPGTARRRMRRSSSSSSGKSYTKPSTHNRSPNTACVQSLVLAIRSFWISVSTCIYDATFASRKIVRKRQILGNAKTLVYPNQVLMYSEHAIKASKRICLLNSRTSTKVSIFLLEKQNRRGQAPKMRPQNH